MNVLYLETYKNWNPVLMKLEKPYLENRKSPIKTLKKPRKESKNYIGTSSWVNKLGKCCICLRNMFLISSHKRFLTNSSDVKSITLLFQIRFYFIFSTSFFVIHLVAFLNQNINIVLSHKDILSNFRLLVYYFNMKI